MQGSNPLCVLLLLHLLCLLLHLLLCLLLLHPLRLHPLLLLRLRLLYMRLLPLLRLLQISAAWSLALLGGGDKDTFGALFSSLASRLSSAPDSVPVQQLALLAEAQVMAGDKAKLPDQVRGSL